MRRLEDIAFVKQVGKLNLLLIFHHFTGYDRQGCLTVLIFGHKYPENPSEKNLVKLDLENIMEYIGEK